MITYQDIDKILRHFKVQQGWMARMLEYLWWGKSSLVRCLEGLTSTHILPMDNGTLSDAQLVGLVEELLQHTSTVDGDKFIVYFDELIRGKQSCSMRTPMASFLHAVKRLDEAKLCDHGNVLALFQCQFNECIFSNIWQLSQANILNQSNFYALLEHDHKIDGFGLAALHDAKLLTNENFLKLIKLSNHLPYSYAIKYLGDVKLLTQSSFDRLLAYPTPEAIIFLYNKGNGNILTQTNLDVLFSRPELGVAAKDIWDDLYRYASSFTQKDFDWHVSKIPLNVAIIKKRENWQVTGESSSLSSDSGAEDHMLTITSPSSPEPSPKSSPRMFSRVPSREDLMLEEQLAMDFWPKFLS